MLEEDRFLEQDIIGNFQKSARRKQMHMRTTRRDEREGHADEGDSQVQKSVFPEQNQQRAPPHVSHQLRQPVKALICGLLAWDAVNILSVCWECLLRFMFVSFASEKREKERERVCPVAL